jgi:type VI secretion system secreted protein VgrG
VRISAGGSTIVIDGDGIQCITPGDIVEKCSSWKKAGPASETIAATTPPPGTMILCAAQATSANADQAALMDGEG